VPPPFRLATSWWRRRKKMVAAAIERMKMRIAVVVVA
jgi:hypothetical protein